MAPKTPAQSGPTKLVKYEGFVGPEGIRIITKDDWANIGISMETTEFNKDNNWCLDASNFPLDVLHYFAEVDDEFRVIASEEDIRGILTPAKLQVVEDVVVHETPSEALAQAKADRAVQEADEAQTMIVLGDDDPSA